MIEYSPGPVRHFREDDLVTFEQTWVTQLLGKVKQFLQGRSVQPELQALPDASFELSEAVVQSVPVLNAVCGMLESGRYAVRKLSRTHPEIPTKFGLSSTDKQWDAVIFLHQDKTFELLFDDGGLAAMPSLKFALDTVENVLKVGKYSQQRAQWQIIKYSETELMPLVQKLEQLVPQVAER